MGTAASVHDPGDGAHHGDAGVGRLDRLPDAISQCPVELDQRLCGLDAEAHIYCLRGSRERSDRDELHTGFGIGADVFEGHPTRTFEWNSLFELSAVFDGLANIVNA